MLCPNDFFKEGGLLSQVKPGFRQRAGQQELSELIFTTDNHVIAEGPTGFGKSYALLVPAICQVLENPNARIVVSTATLALQDQYLGQDLPTLLAACEKAGYRFTFAAAKGRMNSICKAKVFDDTEDGQQLRQHAPEIVRWAREQVVGRDTGDRGGAPAFAEREWHLIGADEECERSGCPFYGRPKKGKTDCFVYHAKARADNAQIVVTNHALFLLSAAGGHEILGPFDLAIIDEAHGFADQAQSTWGAEVGPRTISKALSLVSKMLKRSGLGVVDSQVIEDVRHQEDLLFEPLAREIKQSTKLVKLPEYLKASATLSADLIKAELKKLYKDIRSHDFPKETPQYRGANQACLHLSKTYAALARCFGFLDDDDEADNWLAYIEPLRAPHGKPYVKMHAHPIEVAPLMRTLVYGVQKTVMSSATLRVKGGFGFFKRETGCPENVQEFVGESPFDFASAVTGYFPKHLPAPDSKKYDEALCDEIARLIMHSKGRALVLFTSVAMMQRAHQNVSRRVPYTCMLQGELPKALILARFKEDVHSCVFATKSFFTGVDVPGEALSLVILAKAPFKVPSDPLFEARCQRLEKNGISSFRKLSMPIMLADFTQAFGRLIRAETDTGIFACLDSRANDQPYGRDMIKALPPIKIVRELS